MDIAAIFSLSLQRTCCGSCSRSFSQCAEATRTDDDEDVPHESRRGFRTCCGLASDSSEGKDTRLTLGSSESPSGHPLCLSRGHFFDIQMFVCIQVLVFLTFSRAWFTTLLSIWAVSGLPVSILWCYFGCPLPVSVLTTSLAVRFVLGLSSHHPSALCAHHASWWRWSVVSTTGKSGRTPLQHAFEMLSFTGVVDSEAVYDNCVGHRVVAEQSSTWEELQLLLSDVFWVSLCLFHSRTTQLAMPIAPSACLFRRHFPSRWPV